MRKKVAVPVLILLLLALAGVAVNSLYPLRVGHITEFHISWGSQVDATSYGLSANGDGAALIYSYSPGPLLLYQDHTLLPEEKTATITQEQLRKFEFLVIRYLKVPYWGSGSLPACDMPAWNISFTYDGKEYHCVGEGAPIPDDGARIVAFLNECFEP